jgi:hypothetical protein
MVAIKRKKYYKRKTKTKSKITRKKYRHRKQRGGGSRKKSQSMQNLLSEASGSSYKTPSRAQAVSKQVQKLIRRVVPEYKGVQSTKSSAKYNKIKSNINDYNYYYRK